MKQTTETLLCHPRAKLNLTLRLLGRRADGFHDIESLVAFATLADHLEIRPAGTLSLETRGPFAAQTPTDSANSLLQACALFARRRNITPRGRILLAKHIPPAAGLGGGSSDAALMLKALAGTCAKLSAEEVAELALSLGADVPICLTQQAGMMRGRGERIDAVAALPPMHLLLVKPQGALTARQVYRRWDEMEEAQKAQKTGQARRKSAGEGGGNPPAGMNLEEMLSWCRQRPNDLQPAAIDLLPEVQTVLDCLRASQGCLLARMSGSGPACFGIYENSDASGEAQRHLAARHPHWWLHACGLAAAPYNKPK